MNRSSYWPFGKDRVKELQRDIDQLNRQLATILHDREYNYNLSVAEREKLLKQVQDLNVRLKELLLCYWDEASSANFRFGSLVVTILPTIIGLALAAYVFFDLSNKPAKTVTSDVGKDSLALNKPAIFIDYKDSMIAAEQRRNGYGADVIRTQDSAMKYADAIIKPYEARLAQMFGTTGIDTTLKLRYSEWKRRIAIAKSEYSKQK